MIVTENNKKKVLTGQLKHDKKDSLPISVLTTYFRCLKWLRDHLGG